MARIDRVRESYEAITEQLFSDKTAFEQYLKFAGKFYKLPSEQSMAIYGTNPQATMVTDFDTWKKFNRNVKRGSSSIAVLDNGSLKHYFDISQTAGSTIPYQWALDKETASAIIAETFEQEGRHFGSFSGCVNYLGSKAARENFDSVVKSLNISEKDLAAFEKSYISMVQYLIAARCELGGLFKYNGNVDLTALDILHSKAEKEKLCEFVQLTGKLVLLSMEKSIHDIELQRRTMDNGRDQTGLVRGGQDVLPRNQGGERQNVQARSGNIRVSGTDGAGTDGGRTEADERADRSLGRGMAEVYDGKSPRSNSVLERSAEMGADTPTDRQGGLGISDAPAETVRTEKSAPDNVRGNSEMGEYSWNADRQGDSRGHSTSVSGVNENNGATFSTDNTEQAAEEKISPAFSDAKISLIADKISELSADLTQKYDGDYAELSFANYMANLDGAEYNSDLSERENAVKMLSGGGTHFITDYLKTVYFEAYEGHIILDEGRSAEQLLSSINSAPLSENKQFEILDNIDKFYVNEENESVIWAYFNPDSDADGQLVYHTFTYDQLFEAIVKDDPMDYLEQVSRTELVDVTEPNFKSAARDFLEDDESFSSRDEDMGAKLSALVEPRYGIFQLKNGENLRDYRFMPTDSLKKDGLYVDRENYDRVYRGRLREGETLDDIYQRFNINRPEDFRGHSLSVSDVICIKQNGKTTAHYVDSFGFTEVPDFTLSREERKARRTLTDNLTLLADNQLASDEMDTLGDKLFRYDEAPKYRGSSNSWLIGPGMTADKFEDITTRYHNGEDVRAELAKGMYGKLNYIEFFERSSDGIGDIEISAKKDENGITFRTKGGFEITHSWETLGDALITAARQEFDRHEELDRRYREQEEKANAAKAPYVTVKPFSNVDFAKIGLDSEKRYTIPEFNEALANADKLYTADENNSFRVDTFTVTLHIGEKNYQFRPMLGAEYGTLSAIMDDSSLVNSSNISITTQEKELVAEIERTAQNPKVNDMHDTPATATNDEQIKASVRAFKEKTAENFSSINGFNSADIENVVRDYVQEILANGEIKAQIVDLAVVGSRSRNFESNGSDLDIAIEFNSDLKEDALFNILHDEPFEIGGVTVDINPIRKEETGTLGDYLDNAEKTIFENHERKAAENNREKSVTAYRVGDFYEFFAEDAQITSDLLNLTLVKRQDVPMTGVPFHAFEDYKEKLAAQGYEVKIGDKRELDKIINTNSQPEKNNTSKTIDDLRVGDLVRSDGAIWRITSINGNFSINFENTDKTSIMPEQSIFGHWKQQFSKMGFEIVPPAELTLDQLHETNDTAPKPKKEKTEAAQEEYGEQLNFFGEPMSEDEAAGKRIIGGVDIEEALKYDFIHYGTPEITDLERAKKLIDVFCEREYDSKGDFTDLKQVSLAYTEDEETAQPIQVNADLEEYRLTYLFNNEVVKTEQYGSLAEMNENALNWLDFDELIHEAIEAKQNEIHTVQIERENIPIEKHDYTITNENLGVGGAKTKFAANIAAIRSLKTIESENRLATPEEQAVLAQYVGWGGLAQAFDENNAQWANEFKQLRELLTDEEYSAAKGSVLNAHYTTPTVINAIYKGLENLGFEGGNILEPAMGVGNFFGVMPEEMRQNSHLHGVELDSISGRIARQLYQTADIQIKGFEKTEFSDNFFDAAVGNVPFGSYGVSDKRYNRENFFIHDYFLAKTLDKLAPGGVAALITTKGTMDKENPKVREYLARRGDLIGAIRLPNNAFKANAGTEVTTDILFFQKREKMAVEMPDWCYISKNSDGVPVNSYFLDHPEMILGEMKQGMEYSLYGNATETACVPIEGANLKEQLEKAVATLKLNNALRKHTEQREKEAGIIPATADVRNFTFAEVGGKMYFRENNIMTEVTETGKRLDRIKALNELRGIFRGLLSAQEENCSDEQLAALQAKLNNQYDRFVKEYGYINDSSNGQIFGKDDDYNSLCALEIIDEENKTVNKSDFFSKRTVKYTAEITHVDTPQEAMQVSIDTRGKMDIPYMAQLCGQEPQQVIDVLKADNLIYLNPLKTSEDNPLDGWEETSEYLSGNVREKLRTAELYAKDNPDYQRNVAALTSVLPPKLEAGDISARIGVSWVDVEDYQKFIEEYAKARFIGESMRRTITGEYKIEGKTWDTSPPAIQIYGTSRMPAKAIFENLLNNRDIVVRDKITDPDGREHYELNKKETDLAQEKARQMKDAFKRWLWETPERRDKYVERYNNLFNCIVGRKFDGSHQTFPGMSPSISLKPHQLDAVMRAKFGGNTLLAHCVGAGKSFEMVAATMEKKRLGLINKACVVVPKHLVGQMANEWLRLYPQAKILTATEKDFDKSHRQKFIGRCCTGDYDAVIMSYEQFEKIPMSMEYRQNFIQREIDTMQSGIDELSGDTRSRANNRSSIKDLEREKKRLEARLEKLIEGGGKTKDTSLTFEQLGFDSLVVDEAHNYKNGLVVSKMNRVSGVQTTPAQKSEDILMKTMFLNENYGEKNIIFATGTPVSNSMTELYIMQRYLRPSLLENAGLQTFDDWASNFGEVVSKAELKPAGAERT